MPIREPAMAGRKSGLADGCPGGRFVGVDMDFELGEEQKHVQLVCRDLAQEFAKRAGEHDREATLPRENYQKLHQAGLFGLTVGKEFGGLGVGLLGYVIAAEELAQGCASTTLSFNMHCLNLAWVVNDRAVPSEVKEQVCELGIRQGKMMASTISEPQTSSVAQAGYAPAIEARRVSGGYLVSGRKSFASMVEASDYHMLFCHPSDHASPVASVGLLVPLNSRGHRVEHVWDTLGMRATRSDSLVLEECFVPDELVCFRVQNFPMWFAGGPALYGGAMFAGVYLGVAVAAYKEAVKTLKGRVPPGYLQSLAHHPDVRHRIAKMGVELECGRLLVHRAAWLMDTQGYSPEANAAMLRAKYLAGELVARITRSALTLGGAHALFKTSPLERHFRDGASGSIMPPAGEFCLYALGMIELGLNPEELLPPLKPLSGEKGPGIVLEKQR